MESLRNKCRPKHQVLVLKCYPRTTKGAVDVKPNSSELSYLLFYATSRRSKIQKIGGFLETRTASDVYRLRIGNVQVTLQILAALIGRSPKDLPLIAPCVLKVLSLILDSRDITMVESSVPTFEAFCEHHDATSLFADQAYVRQYESVVRGYASLASTRFVPSKNPLSKPVAMRWRVAGLESIRSVASSEALSSVTGRQLDVIVPMILENLWTDNDDFLEVLLHRAQLEEKVDAEKLIRRRTSIATVRTAETAGDTNPIALSGSAGDVDRLAEEDIGVLAMQCLKKIFVVPNRGQIHNATMALLDFIQERVEQGETLVTTNPNTSKDAGWAIKIFGMIARWATVQDRYVIIVTAMDRLLKTTVTEDSLEEHVVLTAMVGSLLRSDVNMIGLSVMDVLLGLIGHMKKLLQLPTSPRGEGDPDEGERSLVERSELVGLQRKNLLGRLQQCIGDLATHVYYADQISDMISSILLRLKPARSSSTTSSPHGEKEDAAPGPGSSAVDLADSQSHVEGYFSFNLGKVAALKSIKAILLVANPPSKMTGTLSLSRNRVPIQVWEGTHWILRDPDGQVRKAYIDAFATWLDRETTKADLRARDDTITHPRQSLKSSRELPASSLARRAASSASNREKPAKVSRSRFLQLLHLTIYDNALQYVDFETDYVLLHVLLAKMILRLGINSVRFGLPMVFRLQEDIQEVEAPIHKVRMGSLCHGYLWALSEKFDFEASVVGRAIHNEIVRRRSKHFWVEGINVPPPLVELVGTPGLARPQPKMPIHEIESEALLPFDDRVSLVECIATGYQESSISPPTSPAASPGRTFAHPVLGSTVSTLHPTDPENDIPSHVREQMLIDWSRDTAMMALQSGSKSESLNGSRTGTTGTNRNRLTINGGGANGHVPPGPGSPFGSQHNLRPGSSGGGLAPLSKLRKTSVRSGVSPSPSASSRGYVASVEQLKLVLSGHLSGANVGALPHDSDSGSESMVSYEFTPSEVSFNHGSQPENGEATPLASQNPPLATLTPQRTLSRGKGPSTGPLTSNPPNEATPVLGSPTSDGPPTPTVEDSVPPVPPLPSLTTLSRSGPDLSVAIQDLESVSARDHTKPARRNISSRGGESISTISRPGPSRQESATTAAAIAGMDLQELLRGIDSRAGEASLGNVTRPPY